MPGIVSETDSLRSELAERSGRVALFFTLMLTAYRREFLIREDMLLKWANFFLAEIAYAASTIKLHVRPESLPGFEMHCSAFCEQLLAARSELCRVLDSAGRGRSGENRAVRLEILDIYRKADARLSEATLFASLCSTALASSGIENARNLDARMWNRTNRENDFCLVLDEGICGLLDCCSNVLYSRGKLEPAIALRKFETNFFGKLLACHPFGEGSGTCAPTAEIERLSSSDPPSYAICEMLRHLVSLLHLAGTVAPYLWDNARHALAVKLHADAMHVVPRGSRERHAFGERLQLLAEYTPTRFGRTARSDPFLQKSRNRRRTVLEAAYK